MPVFEHRSTLPFPATDVYAWHTRPGALRRLIAPWSGVEVIDERGPFETREVVLSMPVGPARVRWTARHEGVDPGRAFRDVMVSGPFTRWEHTHSFEPAETGSVLVDHVDYTLPMGGLGEGVAGDQVQAMLERTFTFRHRRTAEDLAAHAGRAPRTFAVSGASGLVGTALCAFLETGGHTVRRFVRRSAGPGEVRWDPKTGTVAPGGLDGVDVVVHLAGENVGERWTAERKRAVMESRDQGTRTLAKAAAAAGVKTFLSASAIGFYGDRGDEIDETTPSGEGFLAEVCRAWEDAAKPAADAGARVVNLRIGVVLSTEGGALAKLLPPFRAGLGGPVGSGRQGMSWIALDDVLRAILHVAFADDVAGPVNVTAPHPVAQADFAKTLGSVLGRPAILPLPAFAVTTMFGEMGKEVLLGGQYVKPRRLQESGFTWLRPELRPALAWELGRS